MAALPGDDVDTYEDDDADAGEADGFVGELEGFTGELVEILGSTSARGRRLGRRAEDARFDVHLLDGSYVQVDEEELRPWTPDPPLEGGFDNLWPSAWPTNKPSDLDLLPLLSEQVVDAISGKGWCIIQLFGSDKFHAAAAKQARRLPDLASPKAELVPDLLGPESRGPVGHLEAEGYDTAGRSGDSPGALWELEGRLARFSKELAPLTSPTLGYTCCGRRETMVWLPDLDTAEPERLSPEDSAVDVLEEHVRFIRTRRLCCILLTGSISGKVELQPREAPIEHVESLSLPLAPGKMLIYRCDIWSHTFRPAAGGSVVLKTWLLDDSLDKAKLMGDVFIDSKASGSLDTLGVLVGPPMPVGYRTHLNAIHTQTSASIYGSDHLDAAHLGAVDSFVKIPYERFDIDLYYSPFEDKVMGKSYVCHAGIMDTQELIMFDNDFFKVPTNEAWYIPPNQREILVGGYVTLHKAGFTKKLLAGQNIGVYVGDTGGDWDPARAMLIPSGLGPDRTGPVIIDAVSKYVTAGRMSHIFGMVGSTANVDTACSSSLVAVGLAQQGWRKTDEDQRPAIADTHKDAALVMASNIFCEPYGFVGLSGATMLAADGRCFTFDMSADGYARGEGFAGLYMMPSDSEDDDARQLACLVGCRTNQDGRSASLTAPSGVAQQSCIRGSLEEAGVQAAQVTLCECHGTGTALGDPIEVGAIKEVFHRRGEALLVNSTKTNLGHIESNAGLTGLLKCVGMASSSVGFANIHFRELNQHLVMDGFPATVQSEHVDTRLNSNLAGVSSFGFGGTNARADIWSLCRKAPRSAVLREPDLEPLDVHVQCPITLGLIHHVTGEPARRRRPGERGAPQTAVLRDVGAPYDIAPQAYEGVYRYRDKPPLHDQLDELKADVGIYVCGPWSSRRHMERMQSEGRGYYSAVVMLGEARYEFFSLCLNRDSDLGIYPAINNANHWIWIEGPDARGEGRRWMIDGRDAEIPAGTPYRITFRWHSEVKTIHWDRLPDGFSLSAAGLRGLAAEPAYAMAGTFSSWHLTEMRRVVAEKEEGEQQVWEAYFRMGGSGEEVFAIFRHGDRTQAVYPSKPRAVSSDVPVRGPDNLRGDKSWLVRGLSGDIMVVRLAIFNAYISVRVASEVRGTRVFRSIRGWDRHDYHLVASWNGWHPVKMDKDPQAPGVYRATGVITGDMTSVTGEDFAEAFRVIVDEDPEIGWRPQTAGMGSGASIVQGPERLEKEVQFDVRSPLLGATFQITLDLTTVDKRKVVTWELLPDEYMAADGPPANGALDYLPDYGGWDDWQSSAANR